MKKYSVSVRELCAQSMLSGSIDNRYTSRGRMQEGIRLHQYVQNNYGFDDLCEFSLSCEAVFDNTVISVAGRADGVLSYNHTPVVEEIKSTATELGQITAPNEVHLAQCRIYAYIYASQNSFSEIGIKVSYIYTQGKEIKSFEQKESLLSLKKFFYSLCEKYIDYMNFAEALKDGRDESIAKIKFPFEFREYQKETINKIYKIIKEGKNVFMNAPTGSGKTLNALYPAIKALPALNNPKIFYLTSKSTQKEVALGAVKILEKKGLKIKTVVITAKEKACMLDKPNCNPIDCPYAEKYYDKLRENSRDLISEVDVLTQNEIHSFAEEHKMCPFELSLDCSLWADVIICDYNYVFDPTAALKRFFDDENKEVGDYIFLVDEAHNLPERSRQMYSAVISRFDLVKVKKLAPSLKNLVKATDFLLEYFDDYQEKCKDDREFIFDDISLDFHSAIDMFTAEADKFLSRSSPKDERYSHILDMYFNLTNFLSIYEIKNESHVFYYDPKENFLKLFCTDAREYLNACLKKGKSGVFFSATFTPLEYYCEILGGEKEDYLLNVKSIFDKDKFKIAVDTGISTTYAKRALFYPQVAERIHITINSKPGNYIVYFPSYAYLSAVYDEYKNKYEDEVLVQERNMRESKRTEFLSHFTNRSTVTAFAVIGGVFSEAVDLVGDKLIGAVICGVSLPMICTERELIKKHYDDEQKNGFDYAYVYPGMNKVLQAMGRVIRTQDDSGCAVLLDERFRYPAYRGCFPPHYDNMVFLNNAKLLKQFLESDSASDGFFCE